MPITLLVDQFANHGRGGFTTSPKYLLENLQRLEMIFNPEKDNYLVFPAGRFVCCITMDINRQIAMLFLDLYNARGVAEKQVEQFESETFKKEFMKVTDYIQANYQSLKDVVVLQMPEFSRRQSAN